MKIAYISKHGKNKQESQDCILVNDEVINNYAGTIDTPLKRICIADGVGGVPGGYEASSFVLNHFLDDKSYKSGEELIRHLIRVNDELIEYASQMEEKRAMATTFTGLVRIDKSIWLMHAGNTRLYTYKEGKISQITTDHTNYQAMVVDGGMEDTSENVEHNVIYCCFGTGKREYLNALQVEKIEFVEIPELILLTSDGIHDHISHGEMENIMRENLDDRNKLLAMLEKAQENGSEDDCTAVIARIS